MYLYLTMVLMHIQSTIPELQLTLIPYRKRSTAAQLVHPAAGATGYPIVYSFMERVFWTPPRKVTPGWGNAFAGSIWGHDVVLCLVHVNRGHVQADTVTETVPNNPTLWEPITKALYLLCCPQRTLALWTVPANSEFSYFSCTERMILGGIAAEIWLLALTIYSPSLS